MAFSTAAAPIITSPPRASERIRSRQEAIRSLPQAVSIHSMADLRNWRIFFGKLGLDARLSQVSGDELGHESYVTRLSFTNIPAQRECNRNRKEPDMPVTVSTNLIVKKFLRGRKELRSPPPIDYRKTMRSVWIAEHLRQLGVHVISPIFAEPGRREGLGPGDFSPSYLYLADLNQLVSGSDEVIDGKLFVGEKARRRYGFIESNEANLSYREFQSLANWKELALQLAGELKLLHSLGYVVARGENFALHSREELVLPFWFFIADGKSKGRLMAVDTGNFQHLTEASIFLGDFGRKGAGRLKEEDRDSLLVKELALSGRVLDKAMQEYGARNGVKPVDPPPWARGKNLKVETAFAH